MMHPVFSPACIRGLADKLEELCAEFKNTSASNSNKKAEIATQLAAMLQMKPMMFMGLIAHAQSRMRRLRKVARMLEHLGLKELQVGQVISLRIRSPRAETVVVKSIDPLKGLFAVALEVTQTDILRGPRPKKYLINLARRKP